MRRRELVMMMVRVIVVTVVINLIRGREMGIVDLLATLAGAIIGIAIVEFITVLLYKRLVKQAT